MIKNISHLTFIVKNLDAMEELLVQVFSARKVYDSGDQIFSLSKERFFLIGDLWIAIMEGESLPTKTYNHTAFKIEESDVELYLSKLKALNLEIRESRPRVEGEGRSIYFYDYDNHLFELHAGTLNDRLERYKS
jgi:catechol 2,3-dioxygenase-like lactoylglutathione lyase family enzyme